MKSIGIVRHIDELGRVVLPKELRDILDIKIKDGLEISFDGSRIILKKHEQTCAICYSRSGLRQFKSKQICEGCIKKIKENKTE